MAALAAAEAASRYARAGRGRFVEELRRLVRFPSVGSQPRHAEDVARCADWLARHLGSIGLERARVVPTAGNPIVLAEWRHAPGRPTLLVYGHYDVQPPEPLAEWRTPPFEPALVGRDLHGRGASDDKGQLFVHVKALESYLRGAGSLPVNVVCLFEGEEESGSPNLGPFLARSRDVLAADVAVVSDTRMLGPRRPALTYSLRGTLALELEVAGPPRELHSGQFGGAVANPLQRLCELVASLHDRQGRIAIPGVYDAVRVPSAGERGYMRASGPSDAEILRPAGVEVASGEPGWSEYERTTVRPALTVNGISGGYAGPGSKAVVPPRALAKLSFRLVPDQEPDEVAELFRLHVERLAPPAVRTRVRVGASARPVVLDRRHPALLAAAEAYRAGFGAPAVLVRSGGTIPVVGEFRELLGIPTVLMGFALPDDGMHGPNEKLHLPSFFGGIETSIAFLAALARLGERMPPARSAVPA